MINPQPVPAVNNAPVVAPPASDSGIPEEVGVYVMLKGKLTEIEPEVVGWQTGGVMKSIEMCSDSVFRHLGIDPVCPSKDSPSEVVDFLESGLSQEVHGLRAANATAAVGHDFFTGIEFVHPVRQIT
jgi:hypothetical protein